MNDKLREAAQDAVDRWFLHLDRENDKALRTSMLALRAALAQPSAGLDVERLARAELTTIYPPQGVSEEVKG